MRKHLSPLLEFLRTVTTMASLFSREMNTHTSACVLGGGGGISSSVFDVMTVLNPQAGGC